MSKTCNVFMFVSTFYDTPNNSVQSYIPQLWANESLMILQENMVAARLVYRDFEPIVAGYGDTVNTRRPAKFLAVRKAIDDDVTEQNAVATNVAVVLNQLVHVTFVIRDAQASLAFKDLVTEFLKPAMIAQAKFVDTCILAQYAQFMANQNGQANSLSTSNVRASMLNTRQTLNQNLAPQDTRNLIWTPISETTALSTDLFIQAQQVGDQGEALKNAVLGRKLGFDNYMSQDACGVSTASQNPIAGAGAVNLSAGYGVGTTTLTINTFTAAIPAGAWITIDGRFYRVVSSVGGATPTSVTIASPGLVAPVANGALLGVSTAGAVNLSAGYANGWVGPIVVSGFTNFPAVGQIITFQTSSTSPTYTVVQANSVAGTILLDRPLEVALSNSDTVNAGPSGQFNFAFHRNAIALVTRPLAQIPTNIGAQQAVVNFNDLSMRASIAYDSYKQGMRVTLDMLFGVKVLDTNLGAVMIG